MTRKWPRSGAACAASLVLLVGACGGDTSTDPDSQSIAATLTDPSAADRENADHASDVVTGLTERSAELHPTLADLPLPPGYEVPFSADEYPAEIDARETVVQHITVAMPSDEVARFMLAEFPDAGFSLVDRGHPWLRTEADIRPDAEVWIYAETPDGLPVQIILQPQGEKTGININLYRAGDHP